MALPAIHFQNILVKWFLVPHLVTTLPTGTQHTKPVTGW